jgi:hypothetical protein
LCWSDEALDNGLADGGIHGETLGSDDGFQFGVKAGKDFGSELGLLKGHCIAWKHMISLNPDFGSDRALKAVESLEQMIQQFPKNVISVLILSPDLHLNSNLKFSLS